MGPLNTYWADGHRVRALSPAGARIECEELTGHRPVTVRPWTAEDDHRGVVGSEIP